MSVNDIPTELEAAYECLNAADAKVCQLQAENKWLREALIRLVEDKHMLERQVARLRGDT